VATGSYDKKINIYNMVKNQITLSLNNNKTSVTGMVINADKTKLVTSGLDKSIAVWSIVRKNGYVEEIVNDKIIYLDELICQIQCSMLRK
jgi:WD40 repeat protein